MKDINLLFAVFVAVPPGCCLPFNIIYADLWNGEAFYELIALIASITLSSIISWS